MRFGITDEIANQRLTAKICLNEIEKCQRDSIGPTFVALIGHRYGTKLLKPCIDEDEFKFISKEFEKRSFDKARRLLESFYELDSNNLLNNVYTLKRGDKVTTESIKDEWKELENLLIGSIREVVKDAYNDGHFNEAQKNEYFNSGKKWIMFKNVFSLFSIKTYNVLCAHYSSDGSRNSNWNFKRERSE